MDVYSQIPVFLARDVLPSVLGIKGRKYGDNKAPLMFLFDHRYGRKKKTNREREGNRMMYEE